MSIKLRNKHVTGVFVLVVGVLGALSCSKEDDLPITGEQEIPFAFRQPVFFPEAVKSAIDPKTNLPSNPLTKAGVELGRRLFYDPILSANRQVSCASCHHQGKGFSDGVAITTAGISGKPLERHSPTLINLAWTDNGFFLGRRVDESGVAGLWSADPCR